MAEYLSQTYENATIPLEGSQYVRCTFKNCAFTYQGRAPVLVERCQFDDDCTLSLLDQAGNAVETVTQLNPLRLRKALRRLAQKPLS